MEEEGVGVGVAVEWSGVDVEEEKRSGAKRSEVKSSVHGKED